MIETIFHRWLRVPYPLHTRHVRKPRKARATILFIHGIGNTGDAWEDVIQKLPKDIRVISIDLLGFGDSPAPSWALYNAKTQAKSVLATYLKLRITTPVIIVGHSMGALVAIEVAKRYPLLVRSMILCSPPLYNAATVKDSKRIKSDRMLKRLFKSVHRHPEEFMKISAIAMKYNLVNKSFNINQNNISSYMAALESMIINQTSLDDAKKISVPTTIIKGSLDPFVVGSNIKRLVKANKNIRLKTIVAGHEIKGRYVKPVVAVINEHLKADSASNKG